MSRSYKKHPHCHCVCYKSNKTSKQAANRAFRSKNKQIIRNNDSLEDVIFKKLREVADVWDFASDGIANMTAKYEKIYDFSQPRKQRKLTTIAEAKRNKNYRILRAYLLK